MENAVLPGAGDGKQADGGPPPPLPMEYDAEDRNWAKRFRRRRKFAQAESYLSSNCFIIIFLFIYVNANLLMYTWGAHDEFKYQKGHAKTWAIVIARGFGYTLNLNCALVIILAARLSFTLLRETSLNLVLPFDKSFPAFHIIVGYSILAAVIGHGVFHMIWIIVWNGWGPGIWGVTWCVCTGFVLAAALVLMVVTAGQNWRSKNFTVFYAIHNAGALFFFIMLCLHGMYNGKPYTFQWVLGPMALYAIDRGVRRMATSKVALELTSSNSVLKGPEVLKITVPKSFNYKAGQYAEIKVPLLAKHEWHPFTIASAPHEAEMVFFVKAVGDWTRALYSAFEERVDGVSTRKLKILVRGPFGAPAQHVGGYERIVLISGGVGSTPFSSICRELHHYINQQQAPDLHSDAPPSMDVSPMTEKLEEKLNLTVNRKFSVRYGDPIVPTNDESTRDHLRSELLLMSDQMSPRPVKQSAFQRADVTDMLTQSEPILKASKFSSRVRPTPRFGGRKASMLTKPKKGAAEKQPKNVKNMIGMSFYKPDGGGDVALEDEFKDVGTSVSEADSTALIEEEFAMKTMKLDKEDVAVSLGQTVGETSDRVQRALVVLHSITFNLILFLILLTRLTIVGYAHIFKAFTFKMNDSVVSFTGAKWLIWADLVMGTVMTCVIVVTILLEFPRQGQIVEKNTGSLSDVFLLIPFSIAAVVLEILILLRQNGNVQSSLLAAMLLIFVLPITGVLLGVRLQRIVGSRIMLADATTDLAYTRMRAVDFIWTTPHAADDSWLLERLIPIANKTQLRLHRYITRETIEDGSDGMKHDDKALSTNFGRPKWDEIFRAIAQRSPSMGKVGVFFCGPKPMAKAVKTSLIKAQTLSNLRGTYLGHENDVSIKSELGAANVDLSKLRRRGSYIRFVFREENFG